MDKPTEAQVKEFWEWCGLHYTSPYWVDDDDNLAFYGDHPIDLNNLFKYAVPRLPFLRMDYQPITEEFFFETMKPNDPSLKVGKGKDPALALFWAIYKVLKEG